MAIFFTKLKAKNPQQIL